MDHLHRHITLHRHGGDHHVTDILYIKDILLGHHIHHPGLGQQTADLPAQHVSCGHALAAHDQDPQLLSCVDRLLHIAGEIQRQISHLAVGDRQCQLVFQILAGLFGYLKQIHIGAQHIMDQRRAVHADAVAEAVPGAL